MKDRQAYFRAERSCPKLNEEHFRVEDSVKEKDDLREEAMELRLFAKEFVNKACSSKE